MEGLIALLGITLVMVDLCAMAYLTKSFMCMIFRLMELKEVLDKD